jgi:hypothetical protein
MNVIISLACFTVSLLLFLSGHILVLQLKAFYDSVTYRTRYQRGLYLGYKKSLYHPLFNLRFLISILSFWWFALATIILVMSLNYIVFWILGFITVALTILYLLQVYFNVTDYLSADDVQPKK